MATWKWYGQHFMGQYGATAARRIDIVNDTMKVIATTSAHTPNQDTHDFANDLTNEVTGTGYTAGGVAVTPAISYDATSNEFRIAVEDIVWGPGATISGIRNLHLVKDTGDPATSPLVAFITLDSDASVSNGTFTGDNDATAMLKITAS